LRSWAKKKRGGKREKEGKTHIRAEIDSGKNKERGKGKKKKIVRRELYTPSSSPSLLPPCGGGEERVIKKKLPFFNFFSSIPEKEEGEGKGRETVAFHSYYLLSYVYIL